MGLALGRLVVLLAPLALAAAMLVIPADEARADEGHPEILGGGYPLHHAAGAGGYLAVVVHLLGPEHEIDVNAKGLFGYTPLHYAALHGRAAIAATLIAAGAEVNAKNNFGYTPLHSAPASVVSLLLVAGADLEAKSSDGYTPLHSAARRGLVSVVSLLLAAGAEVNAKSNDGHTPLYLAGIDIGSEDDKPEHVISRAVLIAAGGHWGEACTGEGVVNPAHHTPPCLCESPNVETDLGECEVVAVCDSPAALDPAANRCDCPAPNLGTDGADAPGDCAAPSVEICGRLTPPQFFDETRVSITAGECVPFMSCSTGAALDRETNTCEFSEESCGSLNPPQLYDSNAGECGDRFYPCHDSAIRKADNSGCECPEGAYAHGDPSDGIWDRYCISGRFNRCNTYGEWRKSIPSTAICHADHAPVAHGLHNTDWTAAITMNSHEIVSHFISDHGRDPGGNNLHLAAEHDSPLAALALIEGGADVNFRPRIVLYYGDYVYFDRTPLHDAVRNSSFRTAKLLLQRGANPDATYYSGRPLYASDGGTPLHAAVRLSDSPENVALVSLLLDKGADPNIRNDHDKRPLDLAYDGGGGRTWKARRGMMAALIAWGARWGDECTGGGIPNEFYNPDYTEASAGRCVCPPHISEFMRDKCECPADSHAQVNGRCLPKDSAQVELEIAKMRLELERLRTELTELNRRLTMLADAPETPPEMLEEVAKQAEVAARGIARRRDNFFALARAGLAEAGDAGPAPTLALSDTEATCRMLAGEVQTHSRTGAKICSGIDYNDTFCIVGSASAFPCVGLFRHVRRCNDAHNRPALDPWHCAKKCADGLRARGAKCKPES